MKRFIGPGVLRGFFQTELWNDRNFDLLIATVPGNNNLPSPIVSPGTGIPYAGFGAIAITESASHKEYGHDASVKPGVACIRPHIHWSPSTADLGNVKWFFEYRIIFGDVEQTGTISVVAEAGGAAWKEQRIEIGEIILSAGLEKVGTQIGFRFYRDPTDPEDTYPGVAAVHTAGWHYPVDSGGSVDLFSKLGL